MTDNQERNAASYVEEFMAANNIRQLTYTGPIADGDYHSNYTAIIGNRQLFGNTIADILEQAQ